MEIQNKEINKDFTKWGTLDINDLSKLEYEYLISIESFTEWETGNYGDIESPIEYNSWCSKCGNHHNESLYCSCGNKMSHNGNRG